MRTVCIVALVLFACGHPDHTGPRDPAPHPATGGDPSCPVLVPGTSVSVEDTPTGAAFVFVTTGDVADVRKRAATLAAMHANHDGPAMAMGMMISTTSTAATSEVDKGARVTFTAKPDDVGALQSELRMHAQHLGGGTCEMAM
jgi:hypothetical protein